MPGIKGSHLGADLSAESKSSTTLTFGMDVVWGFGGCVGVIDMGGCLGVLPGGVELAFEEELGLGFLPKQRKPIFALMCFEWVESSK